MFLFGGKRMTRFIFIFIEVITLSIIFIPMMFLAYKIYIHDFKKTILYILFGLYLSAIFIATGLPQINSLTLELSFQLIPFSQITYDIRNSILNIILFITLGFFLPLLFKGFDSVKKTLICGFLFSLSIEVLQILTLRLTDVNDLITNTLGTLLGYLLLRIFYKKQGKNENRDFYLLIVIIGMIYFFIQPLFSSWLWNMILV